MPWSSVGEGEVFFAGAILAAEATILGNISNRAMDMLHVSISEVSLNLSEVTMVFDRSHHITTFTSPFPNIHGDLPSADSQERQAVLEVNPSKATKKPSPSIS